MSEKKAEKAEKDAEVKPAGGSPFSIMNIIILVVFLAVVIAVECAIASYMIPSAEEVAKMAEAQFALKTPPGLSEHGEDAHGEEGAHEEAHAEEGGDHAQADAHGEKKEDAHGGGEKKDAHGGGEKKDAHGGGEKKDAHGGGHGGGHGEKGGHSASKGYSVEVKLGEFSVRTTQPGQNSVKRIDFKLYGTLIDHEMGKFEDAYHRNEHRIRDSILVIVRNSEETDLSDPSLGLLKRRILEKSNRLLGKPYLKAIVFSDFSFIEQ